MAAAETGSLETTGPHPRRHGHSDPRNDSNSARILLIGRDPTLMSYKAAVLATANLPVETLLPAHARTILQDGADYDVVIFSHTLDPDEVLQIEQILRARRPYTKLLLLVGPRGTPVDFGLFDATLHGLDGPAALIGHVLALLNRESPGAAGSHFESAQG